MKEGFPVAQAANVANIANLANSGMGELIRQVLAALKSFGESEKEEKGREKGRRGKERKLLRETGKEKGVGGSAGMRGGRVERLGGQTGSCVMGAREESGMQPQVGGLGSEHVLK